MAGREQIEQAIAVLETQRGVLDDAVVDTLIAVARERLDALDKAKVTPQRKQVTILFADVSGFMAMAEAMDPEEVGDTINDLWARLDRVIVAHGGTIDKHIGDGVMALFGAPTACEDAPEQAVRAALAIQQEVERMRVEEPVHPPADDSHPPRRRSARSLAVRVGINTGPVLLCQVGTTLEYTAMGDTVNVASRLQEAAPVGGILISHATYRHVQGLFLLQALATIYIRGRTKPVRVYVVHRDRPRAFRVPAWGAESIKTRLVERDAELERLRNALYAVTEERNPCGGGRSESVPAARPEAREFEAAQLIVCTGHVSRTKPLAPVSGAYHAGQHST